MKLLVVSDTHGEKEPLTQVIQRHIERHGGDEIQIFHCGDFCFPSATFPGVIYVRGNCDRDEEILYENIIEIDALRILHVHGHQYKVKETSLQLQYRAMELGANLVFFGHTHIPTCVKNKNILYLNPGSLLIPRFYPVPTYAVVTIENPKAQDMVDIEVEYFSLYGERQKGYGGVYSLPAVQKLVQE